LFDEGQKPKRVGPPDDGWSHWQTENERLCDPTERRPSRAVFGRRVREARGAAERGRGQHVLFGFGGVAPSAATRAGLAIGGQALRESVRKQGRCLTVTCHRFDRPDTSVDRGF